MERKQWDQCAKDYHSMTISPFHPKAKNPIYKDIKALGPKIVADIGTGRGDLLPFLSKISKKVYAIDFSGSMLKIANKKAANNIYFRQYDIRKLSKLRLKLDLAIAANSILHPDSDDIRASFSQIYDSLNDGGSFIGIFPSMESVIYSFNLVFDRESEKYDDEYAPKKTKAIVERDKYSLINGIYDDDGDRQKFYYKHELKQKLKDAGFSKIRFKKVVYPWGEASGDYEQFPGHQEMWDWYIIASKL